MFIVGLSLAFQMPRLFCEHWQVLSEYVQNATAVTRNNHIYCCKSHQHQVLKAAVFMEFKL